MDDFSWGMTRAVGSNNDKAAGSASTADGENSVNSDKHEESGDDEEEEDDDDDDDDDDDEDESEGLSNYFPNLRTPSAALLSNINRAGSVAGTQTDSSENATLNSSVKTWSPGVEMATEPKSDTTSLPAKMNDDKRRPSSASVGSKLTMQSAIDPRNDFETIRCSI